MPRDAVGTDLPRVACPNVHTSVINPIKHHVRQAIWDAKTAMSFYKSGIASDY